MPETLIVNIADRICDIYEWFLETKEYSTNTRAGWIIRSAQDRLLDTTDKNTPKIRKKLEKQPILGTVKFTLPASLNRKARDVEQTVRTESKVLKADQRTGYKFKNVEVNESMPKKKILLLMLKLLNGGIDRNEQSILLNKP